MIKRTVWVLTSELNDYDQEGEYFEAVFAECPTNTQLTALDVPQEQLEHVLKGGGRRAKEDRWYFLREVTPT